MGCIYLTFQTLSSRAWISHILVVIAKYVDGNRMRNGSATNGGPKLPEVT